LRSGVRAAPRAGSLLQLLWPLLVLALREAAWVCCTEGAVRGLLGARWPRDGARPPVAVCAFTRWLLAGRRCAEYARRSARLFAASASSSGHFRLKPWNSCSKQLYCRPKASISCGRRMPPPRASRLSRAHCPSLPRAAAAAAAAAAAPACVPTSQTRAQWLGASWE